MTNKNETQKVNEFLLIGSGTDSNGTPIFVVLSLRNPNEPRVVVQIDRGPPSENWELPVNEALQFRPRNIQWANVDGLARFDGVITEEPGWFERKCAEANCEWFIPFVKRMAAGDNVSPKEIENAYATHNGKPPPRGTFHHVISVP